MGKDRSQLFADYLDGTLDEAGAQRLAELVGSDESAARELLELAETEAALRGRFASDVGGLIARVRARIDRENGDIARVRSRVHARIGGETRPRKRSRMSIARARRAAPASSHSAWIAAAVLFLIGGLFLLLQKPSPRRHPYHSARHSEPATSVPQIGTRLDAPRRVARERRRRQDIRREGPRVRRPTAPRTKEDAAPDVTPIAPLVEQEPPEVAERPKIPAPEEARAEGHAAARSSESMGRIEKLVGYVTYRRGARGTWHKAVEGVPLEAGDRIDTRAGKLRLALTDGTLVFLNARTLVSLDLDGEQGAQVRLTRGEVYCDVARQGEGRAFGVRTEDGTARVLGTRFGVRKLSAFSEVVVEAGRVRVGNEKGHVELTANRATTVSKGRKPGRPTTARLKRIRSWLVALESKPRDVAVVIGKGLTGTDLAKWTLYDDAQGKLALQQVDGAPAVALSSAAGQVGALAPSLKPGGGEVLATFRYDGDEFVGIVFRYEDRQHNLRWRVWPGGAQFACRKPGSGSMVVRKGRIVKARKRNERGHKEQLTGPGFLKSRWHHVRIAFQEEGGKLRMSARWWLDGRSEPRRWMLSETIDAAAVPGPGAIGIHCGGKSPLYVRRLEVIQAR